MDTDCPTTQKCEREVCVDPCDCAQHASCRATNHRGICTCDPFYTGDPYGIACTPSKKLKNVKIQSKFFKQLQSLSVQAPAVDEPFCVTDADCPSKHACFGEFCKNPCLAINPCAQNAECTVQDTLPARVMVCSCKPGFSGKGDEFCEPIRKFWTCRLTLFFLFKILPF